MREEKARADAADEELQWVRDTLQQTEQERDAAQAAQAQAPAGYAPILPEQGTQQLCQELEAAKQELEQLCVRMSASAPTANVAKLQSQLQEAQAALTAQQGAVPESVLQTRVTALEQECQKAQCRVQELMNEGQTLQNRYRDLQAQKAAMEVQLNGQLKVAAMEIDRLNKWVAPESGFSEKQSGEITRLSGEVTRLNAEKDALTKELQDLKSAPPPAAAPSATYPPPVGTGVPPGSPYGSSLPSQGQMLGQYSPNVPPYGMAAIQVAYASPGGQAQRYGLPHWARWPWTPWVCLTRPVGGEGNHVVYPLPSPSVLRQPTVRRKRGLAIERAWGLAAVP